MRSKPRGFTLVELLMVIVIVGILTAILLAAIGPAVFGAKEGAITISLGQLSTALENFQQKYGAYPPTMGSETTFVVGIDPAMFNEQQQTRVRRHLRKMFPRYNVPEWNDLATQVSRATRTAATQTLPCVHSDGGLDINNLDAAESLAFWLGGLPHVVSTNPYSVEFSRFSADPTAPLVREFPDDPDDGSAPFSSRRSDVLFEFTGLRLVDRDGDGWPELLPNLGTETDDAPPLVYFDGSTYEQFPVYPPAGARSVTPGSLDSSDVDDMDEKHLNNAKTWGLAQPYATSVDPGTGRITFAAPGKYQILCSGFDVRYDNVNPDDEDAVRDIAQERVKLHTRGQYLHLSDGSTEAMGGGEFDNLTSFFQRRLEAAMENAP